MHHQRRMAFILMMAVLMGCDENDEPKAHFIRSIPASGGEIGIDETLVLLFDNPPGAVTVDETPATVTGTATIWQAQGLPPGQQVLLEVKWDTGRVVLAFQVKAEEKTPDRAPPLIVEVTLPLSRCHLLYTKKVREEAGKAICDQSGLFFCGRWPPGIPGLEDPFDRHFDPRPSLEVSFDPALRYGDTLIVDTGLLNLDGIAIKFSEPIQKGELWMVFEGIRTELFFASPAWRHDSVWLVPLKTRQLDNNTTYILEIIVMDEAGNELRAKIQFHTSL